MVATTGGCHDIVKQEVTLRTAPAIQTSELVPTISAVDGLPTTIATAATIDAPTERKSPIAPTGWKNDASAFSKNCEDALFWSATHSDGRIPFLAFIWAQSRTVHDARSIRSCGLVPLRNQCSDPGHLVPMRAARIPLGR